MEHDDTVRPKVGQEERARGSELEQSLIASALIRTSPIGHGSRISTDNVTEQHHCLKYYCGFISGEKQTVVTKQQHILLGILYVLLTMLFIAITAFAIGPVVAQLCQESEYTALQATEAQVILAVRYRIRAMVMTQGIFLCDEHTYSTLTRIR